MDFESLVERLKKSPSVDGLLLLGSTGQSTLNAFSDRDLLIVLDECELKITNGAVFCGDVLVDLVFVTRQQVEDLIAAEPGSISLSDPEGKLLQLGPVRHYRPRQVRSSRIVARRTAAT